MTTTAQPSAPTPSELERVRQARAYVHAHACPPTSAPSCRACPTATGLLLALRVLDDRPRDARGARRALHDVVCMSSCGPESDHADRTQARVVVALRKFHAGR